MGVGDKTETPTLLSELGIIESVIQEPKRDPEALTVIGLLTAVKRPQPVDEVFVFYAQEDSKERVYFCQTTNEKQQRGNAVFFSSFISG